jgi:membrane protein
VAYDEIDERNFFRKNGVTLLFTLGGIVLVFLCLTLIVGFPAVISKLGLPPVLQTMIQWISWAVLAVLIVYALGMIYKKAPDRDDPEFKWVSVGSVTAAALWLAGSLLFTWYVNNFGSFDKTYGSFAAIIILMLWFFLTGFVIMLGAEINSEMEHQTARDTTVGEDRPMGSRGAYHADHVAT